MENHKLFSIIMNFYIYLRGQNQLFLFICLKKADFQALGHDERCYACEDNLLPIIADKRSWQLEPPLSDVIQLLYRKVHLLVQVPLQ